jgi:hypothetical protein
METMSLIRRRDITSDLDWWELTIDEATNLPRMN